MGLTEDELVNYYSTVTAVQPTITDAQQVAVSDHAVAILRSDGSVWISGPPADPGSPNQFGFEELSGISDVVAIEATTPIVSVSSFYFLKNDGTVWGIGQQMAGNAPPIPQNQWWAPFPNVVYQMPTSKISGVTQISAGQTKLAFLKSDGSVKVWFNNQANPLTPSSPPANIVKLSSSAAGVHVLTSDGDIYATGSNARGEYGDSTTGTPVDPFGTFHKTDGTDYTDLAASDFSVFAIKDTKLYSWGQNGPRSGRGLSAPEVHTPTEITSGELEGWTSVYGHYDCIHPMAEFEDGCLYVWGQQDFGQFGMGTIHTEQQFLGSPTQIPTPGCAGSPVPNPPWPS